jgi:CDP-diacylglycerol--glycerol-3-phosphate 3-phosphatidyltransferase
MKLIRPWLQRPFEQAFSPLVGGLISQGVHPNTLTTIGFFVVAASATAFGLGFVRTGSFFLLLSGVFDVLDGKVARGTGNMTRFGAFYDSTLDRVGDAAVLGGIGLFFMMGGVVPSLEVWGVAAAMVALSSSLIVSYTRARAEGLNLDCKVGIVQRAERIVGIGVPCLFFGAGSSGLLLFVIVSVLAVLSALTVVQRIYHVYRVTRSEPDVEGSEASGRVR